MSGNKRKPGGKWNQSGGRAHGALAKTVKTINYLDSFRHLGLVDYLEIHAEEQRMEHTNPRRLRKGMSPLQPTAIPFEEEDTAIKALDNEADDREVLMVDDLRLIVGLRVYDRHPDGSPVGRSVSGEEFVATHSRIRQEREIYREGGKMVRIGEVMGVRKGKYMEAPGYVNMVSRTVKERRAPGVLKSIMVRCMPHEAEIAGPLLSSKSLDAAMDQAVAEFAEATGCEIISAAVHRMYNGDLHIHIQYTMVIGVLESKSMLGRRALKAWKEEAVKMAREALMADDVKKPNSSALGARKKRLIAEGKLTPEPEAQIEYRKFKGLRSLREDVILGYSFRQKLNLVRLAEDADDAVLADHVIKRNDERARFRPIVQCADSDLEAKYLDLWLERTWRRLVKAQLPAEALEKIRVTGVEAARDYADYGTVNVEQDHIEWRKKELALVMEKAAYDDFLLASYEYELRRQAEITTQQRIAEMEEQVAMYRKSAEQAEKSAESAKLAEAAALLMVDRMKEQVVEFGKSAAAAEKSAESAKRAEATALQQVRTMEKQAGDFIKSAAEEAKRSVDAAKIAEVAAELRATALAEKVEQFAKSANDTADILKLIQTILDDPAVRALLVTITELWQKIVELAGRVGLRLGGPEVKVPVKPPKTEGIEME